MAAANRYLDDVYLKRHNERFTVKPESDKSAFVPVAGYDVANILCLQEERIVTGDNTVSYQGKKLQLPKSDTRHHYVKCQVRVHHYPDESLAVFHGPRQIARYHPNGTPLQEEKKRAA